MLVPPLIIAIILIIIALVLPIVFKIIFKIKNFPGFCLGIVCSVISIVSFIALTAIGIITLYFICKNNGDLGLNLEIILQSLTDIEELKKMPIWILIIIWGFMALISLAFFLILFFFIKRLYNPDEDTNRIFIFLTAYTFIPVILWNIICLILSLKLDIFDYKVKEVEIITDGFVLAAELAGLLLLIQLAGSSILIMLHYRGLNCGIIWICVVTFFSPVIFFLVGFLTCQTFFFTFLTGGCPILSLLFAIILYCKYENRSAETINLIDS